MIAAAIRRARAARAERGSDAGISMVELLVALIVFGIASTIIVSLFVNTTKAIAQSSALNANTQSASNIMNELSRVIRSATTIPQSGNVTSPAVVAGGNESLTILSIVDSGVVTTAPVKVSFALTSRQVVEQRFKSTADANGFYSFASTATSTRTLPGPLTVPTGTTYLFTYYNSGGTPLVLTSGALLPAQLPTVASIKITLVVNSSGDPTAQPVTLENTVYMPNLGLKTVTP